MSHPSPIRRIFDERTLTALPRMDNTKMDGTKMEAAFSMTGVVIWITGLPSSGKSTLGEGVRRGLGAATIASCLLDGDALRLALHPAPGYDEAGRNDFYRTLGELAALLASQRLAVVVAAMAHRRSYRAHARARPPSSRCWSTSIERPARDPKGLYAAHRDGALRGLPRGDLPFERPERPEITARGGHGTDAVAQIVEAARRVMQPGPGAS